MPVQISTTIAPGGALMTMRVGVMPVHLTAGELEGLIAHLKECRSAMLPRPAPEAVTWDDTDNRVREMALP